MGYTESVYQEMTSACRGGELHTYQCNLCSYKTERKAHILRHLRSHTGERPFVCIYCDRSFVHKHHLDRHCKTAHPLYEQ